MKAILELESMGYVFTVDGDKLRGTCDNDPTDPDRVRALLAEVRQNKAAAMRFIQQRQTMPDPLVSFAVNELGAVCTTGYFEEQADALLARCDNSPHWARSWADLAQRAGWPCWGFPTWADWAADVAGN